MLCSPHKKICPVIVAEPWSKSARNHSYQKKEAAM
jgi:hypothetical protein